MTNKVAISHFKSHCLEIIEQLQTDHKTIIITKRDKPVAKLSALDNKKHIPLFGMFKDAAKITGDLLEEYEEKWDAEKQQAIYCKISIPNQNEEQNKLRHSGLDPESHEILKRVQDDESEKPHISNHDEYISLKNKNART